MSTERTKPNISKYFTIDLEFQVFVMLNGHLYRTFSVPALRRYRERVKRVLNSEQCYLGNKIEKNGLRIVYSLVVN